MLTPRSVVETTPIVVAHLQQLELVRASLLAVPDRADADARRPEIRYSRA